MEAEIESSRRTAHESFFGLFLARALSETRICHPKLLDTIVERGSRINGGCLPLALSNNCSSKGTSHFKLVVGIQSQDMHSSGVKVTGGQIHLQPLSLHKTVLGHPNQSSVK